MSEEEINEIIKDFLELKEIHSTDVARKSYLSIYQEAIQGLLDLYNKEKEKNVAIEIYRKDMPKDIKLIVMRKEDFDRNFSNEYIAKDKIKEFKNKFIEDSKDEKVFMTQSSQINASLISFCNELLEE